MRAAARGHRAPGALAARPRAGADPARGPARAAARRTSCCCPTGRSRSSRSAGSPRSRRRRRATCSSTSRAIRTRSTTASTTSSASSTWTARSTRSGRATTAGEFTLDGERRAFERLIDFFIERLDARPDAARLPLRAVRADRAQAPDGPLRHARGRGRPTAPRRRPRRPAARRPPGAARVGRELLDQEAGGVLRLRRARSTCATRARASSRSSSGSSSARASGPEPTILERIERYNRDDVVSNLRAPRLAGGPARRARRR